MNFQLIHHVVEINQENGDISISRKMSVVEEVKNKFLEITLKSAKKINGAAQLGDVLLDPLPAIDFSNSILQFDADLYYLIPVPLLILPLVLSLFYALNWD